MTVSCTQFEDLLLDLAYGELDDETSDRLRTHAAGCPSCRSSLEEIMITRKLVSGPSTPEPGSAMDAVVLEAAVAAAARSAAEQTPEGRITAPPAILNEVSWFERFRFILLKPAFATAAAAAMVLLVTTFLVSKSPKKETQPRETIESLLEQSPVLDGRSEFERKAAAAPPPKAETLDEEKAEEAAATADPVKPSRPQAMAGGVSPGGSGSQFNLGTKGAVASPSPSADIGTPSSEPSGAVSRSSSRRARGAPSGGFPQKESFGMGYEESADDRLAAPKKKASAAQESVESEPLEEGLDDLSAGMAAYRRGDCDQAKLFLGRVASSPGGSRAQKASALHHIARCEKRRGQCGRAAQWYDKLLAAYPGYSGRGDALYEAAQCRRRLGHLSAARSLLDELSQMPGEGARAKSALDRLDAPAASETME
jgi:TolA-binding protein